MTDAMATINAILATTRKDLKLLRKDPAALVMLFILPLVFILVMSFAMAGMLATGGITMAVADEDGGAIGKELVRSLKAAGGFTVVTEWQGKPLDRATVERLIRERKEQVAVVVPAGLDAALAAGRAQGDAPRDLLLIADPSLLPQVLAPVRAVLTALAQQAAYRARGAAGDAAIAPLKVRDDVPAGMSVERKPNSVEQSVPGYTLFGLFFIAMQLATNIIDERQLGTYHRLLAAPLPRWALLVGKLLAFVCINVIQVAVLFAIGVLLLPLIGAPQMSIGPHPEGLLLVTLAVAFAANSLGLALAAITRTRGQAAGLGIIIVITSAMLGGVMVPRYVMPDAMQVMGWISPHTWALMAYQDVLMRGAGVLAVLPEVAILLVFAAVFFGFAAWRFRWA